MSLIIFEQIVGDPEKGDFPVGRTHIKTSEFSDQDSA